MRTASHTSSAKRDFVRSAHSTQQTSFDNKLAHAFHSTLPNDTLATYGPPHENEQNEQDDTCLSATEALQVVEEALNNETEWFNIQNIVRTTFRAFYELYVEQQCHMGVLAEQLQQRPTKGEVAALLAQKADISDVSKAVTDVIKATDVRTDIDELRKEISGRLGRSEGVMQLKSLQSQADELKRSQIQVENIQNEIQDTLSSLKDKCDDMKKDTYKKVTSVYKELEKWTLNLERKVSIDDFTERMESKVDKAIVSNALHGKANKVDLEAVLTNKADIKEIDKLMGTLETKFDNEFQQIKDIVSRKASIDDFNYYRKEINFKLDRSEIEGFRQEFVERLTSFDQKLQEKASSQRHFKEALQSVESTLITLKQQVFAKIDSKVELADMHVMKQDMRSSLEKVNEQTHQNYIDHSQRIDSLQDRLQRLDIESHSHQEVVVEDIARHNTDLGKLKDQIKQILSERQTEINQISDIMKSQQKKSHQDLQKMEKELTLVFTQKLRDTEGSFQQTRDELEETLKKEVDDKVRVEEVQDALKRLTENMHQKMEALYSDIAKQLVQKQDDTYSGLHQLKGQIGDLQTLIQTKTGVDQTMNLTGQLEAISCELGAKAEKKTIQAQIDFLNESLSNLNKEMLVKAGIKDIYSLLDKKSNNEEITLDLEYIKKQLKTYSKEFKAQMQDQSAINEALCSENCVARWIWKGGEIEPKGSIGYVRWDQQTVNTCPDNFKWKQGVASLTVDAPGLYEASMAFFSRKKRPIVQVYANEELLISQTCQNHSELKENNSNPRSTGLYKVNTVEFLTLAANTTIQIAFAHSKGGKGEPVQHFVPNAEGFFSLRKL